MRQKPRLFRSDLTGRVYVVTRYREGEFIEAITKYDVTEDFEALTAAPEEVPVTGSGVVATGDQPGTLGTRPATAYAHSSAASVDPGEDVVEARDESVVRREVAMALTKYLTDEPGGTTFRGLIEYLPDESYSGAYAEGWMDFNNALYRAMEHAKQPISAPVDRVGGEGLDV